MNDDDLLREASDPTTPSERLEVLFSRALSQRRLGRDATPAHVMALLERLVSNPALPAVSLSRALWFPSLRFCARRAWYNPAVPALLLSEPRPEHRDAARRLLATALATHDDPLADATLETLLAAWAALPLEGRTDTIPAGKDRDLARHLAGLFGLPWREP